MQQLTENSRTLDARFARYIECYLTAITTNDCKLANEVKTMEIYKVSVYGLMQNCPKCTRRKHINT